MILSRSYSPSEEIKVSSSEEEVKISRSALQNPEDLSSSSSSNRAEEFKSKIEELPNQKSIETREKMTRKIPKLIEILEKLNEEGQLPEFKETINALRKLLADNIENDEELRSNTMISKTKVLLSWTNSCIKCRWWYRGLVAKQESHKV